MNTVWIQETWTWLLDDPTGQRVGLGIALAAVLVGSVLMQKGLKWATRHGKHLPALAVTTLGLFYAAVLVLQLDPAGWAVAAVVASGVFLGSAMLLNQRRQKKPA